MTLKLTDEDGDTLEVTRTYGGRLHFMTKAAHLSEVVLNQEQTRQLIEYVSQPPLEQPPSLKPSSSGRDHMRERFINEFVKSMRSADRTGSPPHDMAGAVFDSLVKIGIVPPAK